MTPDTEQKQKLLNEILGSPEFRESKRYQELLQYLVRETLTGSPPKEITIGMQFFGKESSFDPKEDPTVRVYINNLRKKLDHYYLTCDNYPPFKLIIPKGHYQVEFIENLHKEPPPFAPSGISLKKKIVFGISLLAVFSIGFLSAYLSFPHLRSGQKIDSIVWDDFIKEGSRPTVIVLGDFFFLFERQNPGHPGKFIRDLTINSPDDYKKAIRDNPEFSKQYIQSDFTFLRPSASWGLASIIPILENAPQQYSIKLASQFAIDDAKSNNIIYIGSFKNLYSLQKILHIFKIDYTLSPSGFHLSGPDSAVFYAPSSMRGGAYEKDYAIAAKARGTEGNFILMLLGFAETGVIEATRFVSDPGIIGNSFALNNIKPNSFFTAIIETEGINQSIFKTTLRYLNSPVQAKIDTSR